VHLYSPRHPPRSVPVLTTSSTTIHFIRSFHPARYHERWHLKTVKSPKSSAWVLALPTGLLYRRAIAEGYASVAHYLVLNHVEGEMDASEEEEEAGQGGTEVGPGT